MREPWKVQRTRPVLSPGVGSPEAGGWLLVWTLAAAQLVSWGTLFYAFSLFVLPMEAELGWTRPAINGALSAGLLVSGLSAFPVGRRIDLDGGRGVMSFGALLAAALLALWSSVDTLPALYAVWTGIGVAMAATLYEPAFAVLTRTFPSTYARRITAVTLVAGFASTVFLPLTQALIDGLGWRKALLVLAVCNAAICFPVYASLPAGTSRERSDHPSPEPRSDALRRALRRPAFWGLAVSFTAHQAAVSALLFHVVPMLFERGVPATSALRAIALIGPSQVAGRLLMLARRESVAIEMVGRVAVLFLPASLILLATLAPSPAVLVAFAVVYGAGNGVMTIVRGTTVPALFGTEGYASLNGAIAVPAHLASAAAPLAAAFLREASGSYATAIAAMLGTAVVSAVAYWAAAAGRAR